MLLTALLAAVHDAQDTDPLGRPSGRTSDDLSRTPPTVRPDVAGETSHQSAVAEDAELLARLRQGDEGAFDAIVTAHTIVMVGFGITLLGSREAAEDVVQDLFLWLWDRRTTFTLQGSLRTYLLTAVRRRAQNIRAHADVERRHAADVALAHEADASLTTASIPDDISSAEVPLWDAVQRLPLRWREAVTLRYVSGLSHAEVGRVLDVSEAGARMLVRRGLDELRRRLNVTP